MIYIYLPSNFKVNACKCGIHTRSDVMKRPVLVFTVLALLLVGTAIAADPINAAVETQGISSTTGVVVLGSMTDSKTIVMTGSNLDLRNNPPLGALVATGEGIRYYPGLDPSNMWSRVVWEGNNLHSLPERQTTMSYTGSVLADNGYSEFNEVQAMDTGNKVVNQDNFRSTSQFDYVSFDDTMGRATTSESLLLDLVSQGSLAAGRFTCPFATGDLGFIPPYCNVYEMGSSFSGSQVSETTQAGTNFIAKSADVPTEATYSVGLSGTGSASSWINSHVMEGRTAMYWGFESDPGYEDGLDYLFWNPDTGDGGIPYEGGDGLSGFMQSVDLVYKEKTTASGVIEGFSKSAAVQDGVRRL